MRPRGACATQPRDATATSVPCDAEIFSGSRPRDARDAEIFSGSQPRDVRDGELSKEGSRTEIFLHNDDAVSIDGSEMLAKLTGDT